jgi:hypothetical protein
MAGKEKGRLAKERPLWTLLAQVPHGLLAKVVPGRRGF